MDKGFEPAPEHRRDGTIGIDKIGQKPVNDILWEISLRGGVSP
jgi:hypothetical protein